MSELMHRVSGNAYAINAIGWKPALILVLFSSVAFAADVSPEHAKFFENKVRPLLAEKCFSCHGEEEQNGDLRLDSLAAALQGGESGSAVVPGHPDESLLVDAIKYESLEMPPEEKLTGEQIDVLTRWVAIGAPWPGADPKEPVRKREQFDAEDRAWWAIQPVAKPEVPKMSGALRSWPRNEIDHFIAAQMESQGLVPAPEATKQEIVRRLYLDVIGLPPTPNHVAEFVNDTSPNSYERLVDQLLDSKGYGEHAARQWLDLVRYADSDGYRADGYRPHAWRYRDYVISSMNDDKPYDRFVQEQLAADELFPDNIEAQAGLGYLRHWVYEWNIRDAPGQWKTILEDLTDTTADAFLGLGLQCAKCHNHKFDPLLQKDYYRLQAFLTTIMPHDKELASDEDVVAYHAELAIWEGKTAELRGKIDEIEAPYKKKLSNEAIDRFPDDIRSIARKAAGTRTPYEEQLAYLVQRQVQAEYDRLEQFVSADDKEKLLAFRRELKEFDSTRPKPLPVVMTVADVSEVAPQTFVPKRGDEEVLPGVPSIMNSDPMAISTESSLPTTGRRSALARWITDSANPLSTRVIANRVWQSHFGRGLAANPSDFGRLGGSPSHPELLDWLTTEFVDGGWSLKSLHRRILLSATYRQSTSHPRYGEFVLLDPANDLYWRRNTTRLSAEQIRDSLLTVTGSLKDYSGGPGKQPDSPYRSIYLSVMRNSPDQLLDSFDLPQFFSSNSTRNTTTTPVQSLLLFNSDQMLGYGRKLASELTKATDEAPNQVQLAWEQVFGRKPTPNEVSQSLQFLDAQRDEVTAAHTATTTGLIETSKLPYRDGQGVKFDLADTALQLSVLHDPAMDSEEFTIEAFFQLRSIAKNGDVRTIAAKWDGSHANPGWRFGVTGAGSRRKPQTLVLQMAGIKADGEVSEEAIFSDQHIDINTPYYASAAFRLPRDGQPGTVTFYLKDLSNDDEQLLTSIVPHAITNKLTNPLPLTFGGYSSKQRHGFDGLIDDVRLVGKPLGTDEILQSVEREHADTIGYWQFETVPGVMRNTESERLGIIGQGERVLNLSPTEAALADFCHTLLNSNEFLYVH